MSRKKIGVLVFIIVLSILLGFTVGNRYPYFLAYSYKWAQEHEYINDTYMCGNFARDIAKGLNDAGYPSCIVHGMLHGKRHDWVASYQEGVWIHIEATVGRTIRADEFSEGNYTYCREQWECFNGTN